MRRFVLATALVLATSGLVASPAGATKPLTAAGPYSFPVANFIPIRDADGNSFFLEKLTVSYSGGLTGIAHDTAVHVVHKDGSFNDHGTEICTGCSLGGRVGNYTAVFTDTGSPNGAYAGHFTFTKGSGGLAGLRGQGTFQGNNLGNTYSYNYSFGP